MMTPDELESIHQSARIGAIESLLSAINWETNTFRSSPACLVIQRIRLKIDEAKVIESRHICSS